jgi:hypothetical protein
LWSIINKIQIFLVPCTITFYNEFFQLCLVKNNLEANLKNHMEGTKLAKMVEDVFKEKRFQCYYNFLTRQRGTPSTSTKNIPKNQRTLRILKYHLKVRLITSLVCCVAVIGPRLANMLQTKPFKLIIYCKILFLGLHGLQSFKLRLNWSWEV